MFTDVVSRQRSGCPKGRSIGSLLRPSLISFVLMLCAENACAANAGPSPQVWMNPGLYSEHFNKDKNLRNDNLGVGAEVHITGSRGFMIGSYVNSNCARSHYGAYLWRPMHWSLFGLHLYAGAAFGVIDGYPNYKHGGWFPIVLPLFAIEGRRVGANFSVIPTISNRVDGAVAIQVKLRVW